MSGASPQDSQIDKVIESAVRELLSAHLAVAADAGVPLALSSLELVVITEELEARFGFVVAAREVVPQNFGSLRALCALVARRLPK